jgi:hypothetical protein
MHRVLMIGATVALMHVTGKADTDALTRCIQILQLYGLEYNYGGTKAVLLVLAGLSWLATLIYVH